MDEILNQVEHSKRIRFTTIAMIIACVLIFWQVMMFCFFPQELFDFYSSIGLYKLLGYENCSQCGFKIGDYVVGDISRFDFGANTCKEGYVEFWINDLYFECVEPDVGMQRCYDKRPVEYFIEDGDLYKRTVEISGGSVICATRIMDGYPADFDGWIKDHTNKEKDSIVEGEKK